MMDYDAKEPTIYNSEDDKYEVQKEKNKEENNSQENKFLYGLENAKKILDCLNKSLQKTKKYEKQLLTCRSKHAHSHHSGWINDYSVDNSNVWKRESKKSLRSDAETKSQNIVDLADSWSTKSISCLQYQYYELTRRYEALVQAYDDRCRSVAAKDSALALMRKRAMDSYTELSHAHKSLISVGEKYLALKNAREHQTQQYEDKVEQLKYALREMLCEVERARNDLDLQLGSSMTAEKHAATALLLAEIRKCNLLYLENVRLKEQMAELA